MNAPWKPGQNARDAFQAYVCDEHSFDVVRAVVAETGWPVEKVAKGGLRNAVTSLSMSASPNILFVDLSESSDPLSDISNLAEVCEPGTVVIAAGQINDVRLYRDLVASGIQDYLLKPFSPDQIRDAIANAQALLMAPKPDGATERPHIATAVIGTRGGVGASTLATSLAWLMSTREKRLTALFDLDVHFGTGALSLDLEPGRGLTDAIENPGRIDGLFIERAMVRASDTLAILSAEAPISQPLITDGSAFHQLQEEFRSAFECTVVDLPRHMLVNFPHLAADASVITLVTELTLAGARDTIRLLSWLKNAAPQSRVLVVANKVIAGASEISLKDFEQSIERNVDVILPDDPKAASQAAKLGKTIAEAAKNTKLGLAMGRVTSLVVDSIDEAAPDAGSKPPAAKGGSLVAKLGDLGGLLSKRKVPAKKAEPAE